MAQGDSHVVSDWDIEELHRCWGWADRPVTKKRMRVPVGHAASLREVAAELHLSTERVRQIERRALEKCRRFLSQR